MQKEDCFHQVAWSLVQPGATTERAQLAGGLDAIRISSGSGGLQSLQAQLLEQALAEQCQSLPEELDLTSAHFGQVEAAIKEFMQGVRGEMVTLPADSAVSSNEETALSKLRELAEQEKGGN